jgi:TIR domain
MIFLSYNWRDQAIAHEVDVLLRRSDFDVWIDYRNLQSDEDIITQLDQAIQRCSVFVMVKSGRQNGSRWMRTELSIALAYGKAVLPLRADALRLAGQVGAASRAITAIVAKRSLLDSEKLRFPNLESGGDPNRRGALEMSVT